MTSRAEFNHKRGKLLQAASDFTAALSAYDVALSEAPQNPEIHYDRGNTLIMLRRPEEALCSYERCLAIKPGHPLASYNRATALVQLQRWGQALQALDDVTRRWPTMAEAWNNRSGVLQALGRYTEALDSTQRVLKLRPLDAQAFYNAGIVLLTLKRFDEAEQALERAFQLNPNHIDALGCLASAALRSCDWPVIERIMPELTSRVKAHNLVVPPLTLLALTDDAKLQRCSAELNLRRTFADTALPIDNPRPMAAKTYDHRKLKIGYLSSDFREHPVAAQIVGLLENHDRARFEVVGLFSGNENTSTKFQRIVDACDEFFAMGDIGSREAAGVIRNAEIDILVDLNGQTMGWNPAVLKFRPAPVIATYLGYAGTTGAEFVDYILGDPHVTPFELAWAFSEKIVQLGDTFWPSDPMLPEPEVVDRIELGLPADAFVFCCFNSNHKIRPELFDVWCRLLRSVPNSVLWIRDGYATMNERFLHEAQNRGVDEKCIIFAGHLDNFARHLGRISRADLFLDTFPYNAHATASDALWAGLPLLTLRGQSFVSRVSAGFLMNLGLNELIASTLEEYEAIALALAASPNRLRNVRDRLNAARCISPIFNVRKLTPVIEAAYIQMYDRAKHGQTPAPFKI